jgi:hypothetical protein
MQLLEVGSHLKCRIAHITNRYGIEAEQPWGQVVSVVNDHRIIVKLDNELVSSDLHGLFLGDLVELELTPVEPHGAIWQYVGKIIEHKEEDLENFDL